MVLSRLQEEHLDIFHETLFIKVGNTSAVNMVELYSTYQPLAMARRLS